MVYPSVMQFLPSHRSHSLLPHEGYPLHNYRAALLDLKYARIHVYTRRTDNGHTEIRRLRRRCFVLHPFRLANQSPFSVTHPRWSPFCPVLLPAAYSSTRFDIFHELRPARSSRKSILRCLEGARNRLLPRSVRFLPHLAISPAAPSPPPPSPPTSSYYSHSSSYSSSSVGSSLFLFPFFSLFFPFSFFYFDSFASPFFRGSEPRDANDGSILRFERTAPTNGKRGDHRGEEESENSMGLVIAESPTRRVASQRSAAIRRALHEANFRLVNKPTID